MEIRISKVVTVHFKVSPSTITRLGQGLDMEVVHKKEAIGSAYKATGGILRGLDKGEEKKYLPMILGVSPTAPEWEKKCEDYWANISVAIPPPQIDDKGKLRGGGKSLEVGFIYTSEEDAEKGNAEARKEALRFERWLASQQNALPSKTRRFKEDFSIRQSIGEPINLDDYIFYRYCLAYSRVALSKELAGASAKIRFFIEDSQAEIKARHATMKARRDAAIAFAETLGDRKKVGQILNVMFKEVQQILEKTGENFNRTVEEECDLMMEQLSKEYPVTFVNVVKDERLNVKSFIEHSITVGVLRRYPNTNTIVYGDNTVIGNSLDEAVSYISDEKNLEIRNQITAKVKTVKVG